MPRHGWLHVGGDRLNEAFNPIGAGKRILVLDHTAALGGAEIALSRLLAALKPTGFQTDVVLLSDGPLRELLEEAGHQVDVLPLAADIVDRSRNSLMSEPLHSARAAVEFARFAVALAGEIRSRRPDLVMANSLKSALFASVAAPLARRPWVWHLHDRLSSDYLPGAVAAAMRALARYGPRHVVANSGETLACLGAIRPDRTSVAYPGLPSTAFGRRLVEPEGKVIGIVGRISSTKGQREFLSAAALVARHHADARFRVIGTAMFNDHDYEREVRALADQLGISDRVTFTGWVSEAIAELDQLSLMVHASPVPEPFGQVVAEAMARGVPVIATRGGGVTEILDPELGTRTNGRGSVTKTALGQLVNPGDVEGLAVAMEWVLDHPEEAAAQADAAFISVAERFNIGRTADVVQRVWQQALSGGSERRLNPLVHARSSWIQE